MNILVICFFMTAALFGAEVLKDEKTKCGTHVQLIEFNGHTWIYVHEAWKQGTSTLVHDPDCKKCYDLKEKGQKLNDH